MEWGDPLLCPVSTEPCSLSQGESPHPYPNPNSFHPGQVSTEPLCRAVAISGCGHVFSEASLLKGALQAKAQVCPPSPSP